MRGLRCARCCSRCINAAAASLPHPHLHSRTGKAGGFLAKDWDQRRSTRAFTRTSYELHAQLAAQFGAERVGYRPVHTLSVGGAASWRCACTRARVRVCARACACVGHTTHAVLDLKGCPFALRPCAGLRHGARAGHPAKRAGPETAKLAGRQRAGGGGAGQPTHHCAGACVCACMRRHPLSHGWASGLARQLPAGMSVPSCPCAGPPLQADHGADGARHGAGWCTPGEGRGDRAGEKPGWATHARHRCTRACTARKNWS